MIGSVWGPSSASAPVASLTSSLSRQFDRIGLDGPICAEYILSLLEMYKTPGDRSAAISDFVMDSIASSSVLKESQHNSFVSDVLSIVAGNSRPPVKEPSPEITTSSVPDDTLAQVPKKGFKKGTKLSGMALKQVVGNVKPSFVQKYSDDESEQIIRPSIAGPSMVRTISSLSRPVEQHYFPSLETKSSGSSSTDRVSPPETPHIESPVAPVKKKVKKGTAREVGPDEAWSDDEEFKTPFTSKKLPEQQSVDKKKLLTVTGFNSVKISPPPPPPKKTETPIPREHKVEDVKPQIEPEVAVDPQIEVVVKPPASPAKVVSILDTTPPPAALEPSLMIPSDILSFDFQFEGEDEDEQDMPPTETFDLLRQMFGGLAPSPPIVPAPAQPSSTDESTKPQNRQYSAKFLLHVLSSMGSEGIQKPDELLTLCSQGEYKRKSPQGDMSGSWRANGDQTTRTKNWKSFVYDEIHKQTEDPDPTEQGFW